MPPLQICVCTAPCHLQLLPNQSLPCIQLFFGKKQIVALVDTGAQIPLIDKHFCEMFLSRENPQIKYLQKTVSAVSCNKSPLKISGCVIGELQFHEHDNPAIFGEFYILDNCSQQCIFPHPWLSALKINLSYANRSIQYVSPPAKNCLLSAEGLLIQPSQHKQDYWTIQNYDDEVSDNQQNCQQNHDDCDHDGDHHHRDDMGQHDLVNPSQDPGVNPDDFPQLPVSSAFHRKHHPPCTPSSCHQGQHCNSIIHLPILVKPKSTVSRSLSKRDISCLKKIQPGSFPMDQIAIFVWKRPNGKFMLRAHNAGDQPTCLKICQLDFNKNKSKQKLLPVTFKTFVNINQLKDSGLSVQSDPIQIRESACESGESDHKIPNPPCENEKTSDLLHLSCDLPKANKSLSPSESEKESESPAAINNNYENNKSGESVSTSESATKTTSKSDEIANKPKGESEKESDNPTPLSEKVIKEEMIRLQSQYSAFSKSLDDLSLTSTKIQFSVPANFQQPFNDRTSPLDTLHVYLLYIIGSNFSYMSKSLDELKQFIKTSKMHIHHNTLARAEAMFKKGRVHKMYSHLSLYIAGITHYIFLDHQRKCHALQSREESLAPMHSAQRSLQQKLLQNIRITSALFFFNQKLINEFFETTLLHPYYQQLNLPFSFQETISSLNPEVDQDVSHILQCDSPVNQGDGLDGAVNLGDICDKGGGQNDGPVTQGDYSINNPARVSDSSTEIGNNSTPQSNSLALLPPAPLPHKSSLEQLINQKSPPYNPKQLSFSQYKSELEQSCEEISNIQEKETRKSCFSGKKIDLASMSPQQIKDYVAYSKTTRRLVDFIEDQIPSESGKESESESEKLSTVPQLLDNIPLPQWVNYTSAQQILNDYIPACLRSDFDIFYSHFKDPVFIKFSASFSLPHPPTDAHLKSDPPDSLHSISGLTDPKILASVTSQFISHDHPLVCNAEFELELLHLACILYSFGNFNVSLHSLDTGSFRQEFKVQTLLAPNAPLCSFPSRAATQATDPDLDERIEFLIKTGKCQIILGSPYLNQISSVPKKYKCSQTIHSTKSDPLLLYIDSLSNESKQSLAERSQELNNHQQFLMDLLNDPAAPLSSLSPPRSGHDDDCTANPTQIHIGDHHCNNDGDPLHKNADGEDDNHDNHDNHDRHRTACYSCYYHTA